jgi:hypothetical protein
MSFPFRLADLQTKRRWYPTSCLNGALLPYIQTQSSAQNQTLSPAGAENQKSGSLQRSRLPEKLPILPTYVNQVPE